MKTARLLFVVIGLAAFTIARSLASEPAKTPLKRDADDKQSTSVRPGEAMRGEEADNPERKHSLLNGVNHEAIRSSQSGSFQRPIQRTSPNAFHPPAFKKTATVPTQGWMLNKTVNYHEQPAKLPSGREAAAQFPGLVHGRTVAAAALGGSAAFSAKKPAFALDGTAMKRKP